LCEGVYDGVERCWMKLDGRVEREETTL
jgi:hypothetical protein